MGSFWDYMKPSTEAPQPTALDLVAGRTLQIRWSDGLDTPLGARALRQNCPCAACVDEWTHQRTLKPDSVPEDIGVREVQPVGNYAVQLAFSDGHQTGIFTWTMLRELSTKPA